MTSPTPPRDWTEIHWPDIAAAGRSRWIAVLPLAATEQHGPHLPLGTDVMIGEAYLARVRELLPATLPVTFLPLQPVGISTEHIDYPGTLTLSDRGRAERVDGARRKRRARRHQKTRDRDEPWRQQRCDDAGRAGSARATWAFGGDHELVALRRAGRIVLGRRTAPRHPWRRGRNLDHAGAISGNGAQGSDRRFSSHQHRDRKGISLAVDAAAGAVCLAGAGSARRAALPAMRPRPPQRRASSCSITAPARSANCSPTSITST